MFAMTGQISIPSSSSHAAVGSHDTAAALSPPLILSTNGNNNLTENQSKKNHPNPISPADDSEDPKFTDTAQLIQENELVLKDSARNVLNVSENLEVGRSRTEATIIEEPKTNLFSDGLHEVRCNPKTCRTSTWGKPF